MKKVKYVVIGEFRQAHKDSTGETMSFDTYSDAYELQNKWRKEKKYKDVWIDRKEYDF